MSIEYYIKSWPRAQLGRRQGLFVPFYRAFGRHKQLLVGPDTDIVIDGFPRSANTFSVVAFEHAQTAPVNIAHHLHVVAQILYAVDKGIPAIVLLREPGEAVASLVTRHPETPISGALHEYIWFYSAVMPVADRVVIGHFDEVTDDFGSVIARVNQKYGTEFGIYTNTDRDKAAVFDRIKEIHKEKNERPNQIALPSENKSGAKNVVKEAFKRGSVVDLLAAARECYAALRSEK